VKLLALPDGRRATVVRTAVLTCVLSLTIGACDREPRSAAAASAPRGRAAGRLEPAQPPYRIVDVRSGGAVLGRITVAADVPRDSIVPVTADQRLCGSSVRVPLVERSGSRVANVIVWLADARSGKPLPLPRRFELTNERCSLEPRVQAAVVGGTLNVKNADPTLHRTRFLLAGTDSTVALVTEHDRGQVVPTQKVLAHPDRLEVRCDAHPWTHAWIQVFDHPYFDVTGRDGQFAIDSVPPGRYRLMAWQERLGTKEMEVTVEAGREAKVEVKF
jgi:hypothetical protein